MEYLPTIRTRCGPELWSDANPLYSVHPAAFSLCHLLARRGKKWPANHIAHPLPKMYVLGGDYSKPLHAQFLKPLCCWWLILPIQNDAKNLKNN